MMPTLSALRLFEFEKGRNMISSMTGFARQTFDDRWGSITWEIRAVNHRYLDISIRLPEALRHQENMIREMVQQKLKRGKLEVTLKFNPGELMSYNFKINQGMLTQLAKVHSDIIQIFPKIQTNFIDLLNWQGLISIKEIDMQDISKNAQQLLQTTLDDLLKSRSREGERLKIFIQKRLQLMQHQIDFILQKIPRAIELDRKRILDRFEKLQIELEPERLEQEMLWLMQKIDIAEEVSRLQAHIQEVERVVNQGGVVGRRLDFLMQELNREANTIASKSIDAQITKATIELKVLIEQIREQVQNIE